MELFKCFKWHLEPFYIRIHSLHKSARTLEQLNSRCTINTEGTNYASAGRRYPANSKTAPLPTITLGDEQTTHYTLYANQPALPYEITLQRIMYLNKLSNCRQIHTHHYTKRGFPICRKCWLLFLLFTSCILHLFFRYFVQQKHDNIRNHFSPFLWCGRQHLIYLNRKLYGYPWAFCLNTDRISEKNTDTRIRPAIAIMRPFRISLCMPDSVNRIMPSTIIASEIIAQKRCYSSVHVDSHTHSLQNSLKNITIYVSATS